MSILVKDITRINMASVFTRVFGLLKLYVFKSDMPWLFALTYLLLPSLCTGLCPTNRRKAANVCMEPFSRQYYQMLHRTDNVQLFTGIDIESLRLFCTGFERSMKCVGNLRLQCPPKHHDAINSVLINLSGSEDALHDLCKDDSIYDLYARVMICYGNQRHVSMACFRQNMNITIQPLATYPGKNLCRDVKKVIGCIKNNIVKNCGRQAASLTEKLVLPMVKRSSTCFVTDMKPTKRPFTHKRKKSKKRKGSYRNLEMTSQKPTNSTVSAKQSTLSMFLIVLSLFFAQNKSLIFLS